MTARLIHSFIALTLVGVGLYYAADKLAIRNDLQKAAKSVESYRQKKSDPLASNEELVKTMKLIDGLESPNPQATQENLNAPNAKHDLNSAPQPPSTAFVLDGRSGIDPLAEEQVMNLNVPESVRQEIYRNYDRTGVLPTLRQPANN